MKSRLLPLVSLLALSLAAHAAEQKLNVLHIISDDLCAKLGCYGDPLVKSPNIDRLAAQGVRFEHAYCQYPLCNPSRSSFMTGLRPDTTNIQENGTQFRANVPDAVTIPQSFQKAGYSVARVGKIYHYGVPAQIGTDGLDDPASWEEVHNPKGRDIDDIGMVEVLQMGEDRKAKTVAGKELKDTGGTLSWLAAEGEDSEQTDGKIAATAIEMLTARAKQAKPFYLAVGFFRPHTPYISPKRYFDLYPPAKIKLPLVPENLLELFPKMALSTLKPAEVAMDDDLKKRAIQAYHAATTFMDAQVGKVLDAVDRLGLRDKTIIVFHSDHGYHLGDKNLWQKMTIFEEAARVPLIISVPGSTQRGKACQRVVELVDLHKTLTDLCGVAADAKTQGFSARPLVENPAAAWDHPAYTQVRHGGPKKGEGIGRTVRNERYRFTEWSDKTTELYDHENDPHEMKNLASDPAAQPVADQMMKLLNQPAL